MKPKRAKMTVLLITGIFIFVWGVLTLIVEIRGAANRTVFGAENNLSTALIVYDPDPFYNLDEQVCTSFAQGLAEKSWKAEVVTVAALENLNINNFDLHVFCANTYNWAPDRAISNYIKKSNDLKGKHVAAITLGSGSTARSKRIFEDILKQQEVHLIASKTFWLLKPNDESRTKESNVEVAKEMSKNFGMEIANDIGSKRE